MLVQPGLCRTCTETTLLVFQLDGSFANADANTVKFPLKMFVEASFYKSQKCILCKRGITDDDFGDNIHVQDQSQCLQP